MSGLRARAASRARRLLAPTFEVFGLDADGRPVSPRPDADKGVEARVREADERDDRARLAIAEAEIATERTEKQHASPGSARPNG